MIDGPTLRALRQSKGIPLRRVAKLAGMSHGHLSKVESGDYGRSVTPAVLMGYERATGVAITSGADGSGGYKLGQLSPLGRRRYLSMVGSVALGGSLPESAERILDHHRITEPPHPSVLEAVAGALEALGPACGPVAFMMLRASIRHDPDPVTIARLAKLAADGSLALERYDTARDLQLVALQAAVAADKPDLKALLLVDMAKLQHRFDALNDALAMLRIAEADERISEDTRKIVLESKHELLEVLRRVDAAIQEGT